MPQWRDGAAGLCITTLQGHEGIVRSVAALEGGLLASGSSDNTVKVWDVGTGACEATLKKGQDAVPEWLPADHTPLTCSSGTVGFTSDGASQQSSMRGDRAVVWEGAALHVLALRK